MINTRKNKTIIYIFVACIILAGCYYIFFADREGISKQTSEEKETIQDVLGEHKDIKGDQGDIQHKKRTPEIARQKEQINNERAQFIRDWYEAAKVPIVFYGKVVDQQGSPVVGATVKMSTASHDGALFRETVTDENGLFSLKGVKAKDLYIDDIKLTGYEPARSRWSFNYGARHYTRHVPDQNNPVIFDMWKKSKPENIEPLIKNDRSFKVKFDFTNYYVDLINNRKMLNDNKSWDFLLRMKFEGEKINNKYSKWRVVFESTRNDGFVETNDIFMYKAPDSGYKNRVEIVLDKKNNTWATNIKRKFYLRSQNGGLYAAMIIEVLSHPSGEGLVSIKSIVNPNGSTNLEYDPSKRILDP